jgi:hypothetical protein
MTERLILYVLTCGPFALTLAGWIKLYRTRQSPRAVALVALGAATANHARAWHCGLCCQHLRLLHLQASFRVAAAVAGSTDPRFWIVIPSGFPRHNFRPYLRRQTRCAGMADIGCGACIRATLAPWDDGRLCSLIPTVASASSLGLPIDPVI